MTPRSFVYLLLAVAAASLAASFTLFEIHRTRFLLEMYMEPGAAVSPSVRVDKSQPANPQLDTSTWKTYRNEEYGFEVKYPENSKQFWRITDGFNNEKGVFLWDSAGNVKAMIHPAGDERGQFPNPVVSNIQFADRVAIRKDWIRLDYGDCDPRNTGESIISFSTPPNPSWSELNEITIYYEYKGCVDETGNRVIDQILSTFRFIPKTETSVGDACKAVAGKTFHSIDQREVGLGPSGPVLGYWTIGFNANNTFTWNYSDISQSGTYSCVGDTIVGPTVDGWPIKATYDLLGGILVWDDVDYIKQ